MPNYLFGTPTDHYVSRLALALPLSLTAPLFELMVSMQCGSPFKWCDFLQQQHVHACDKLRQGLQP